MSNQRGFTLLEVLVVTVIGLGIMAGLTQLYLSGQGTYLQASTRLQCQRDASLTAEEFALRTRVAHAAVISGTTLTLNNNAGGPVAQFYVAGNTLKENYNGFNGTFITSTVKTLSFSATGQQITMDLTLTDKYNQDLHVITSAVMRN